MTQKERDRLAALKKAKDGLITQRQAAEEIGLSERQVRRMLVALQAVGDKAVLHASRGRRSNRSIDAGVRQQAIVKLSQPVCRGFGPSFAVDYLRAEHGISVGRETLRGWMTGAKLWRPQLKKVDQVHQWRERKSRRGDKLYLIAMIDDATSELTARFARHDSTEENLRLLWGYLEQNGRPLSFYTDKASLFQTAPKVWRDQKQLPRDEREPSPPTQIGRALNELGIVWKAAHSPQAKGRIERSFQTAQDRQVKGLRVAGAVTLKQANAYLEGKFLPWWNQTLQCIPASSEDAHRPIMKGQDLASSLSLVENRCVASDYTIRLEGKLYQIDRTSVCTGLRGGTVRVEKRLDGTLAARFRANWLTLSQCEPRPKAAAVAQATASGKRYRKPPPPSEAMRRSMNNFLGGVKNSIRNAGQNRPGDLSP